MRFYDIDKAELKGKKKFSVISKDFGVDIGFGVWITLDFDHPYLIDYLLDLSCSRNGHPDRDEDLREHLIFILPIIAYEIYWQLFICGYPTVDWSVAQGMQYLGKKDNGVTFSGVAVPDQLKQTDLFIEYVENPDD